MSLRPALREVLDDLLGDGRKVVTLDDLGDALGNHAVSTLEVDALMTALEERGVEIESADTGDVREDLTQVISTARSLQRALGRRPSPGEIADASGMAPGQVRAALLYARVMSR